MNLDIEDRLSPTSMEQMICRPSLIRRAQHLNKLLAKILDSDTERRLDICRNMLNASKQNHECLMLDHDVVIKNLRTQIKSLAHALIRSMSGIAIAPDSDIARTAQFEVNHST